MSNDVEIVVRVSDDTTRGATSIRTKMRALGQRLASDADDSGGQVGERLLGSLRTALLAGIKPIAAVTAGAFATQFAGAAAAAVASGATKLASGFGAGLALLPAVAATAGMALGALRIAVSGVGDALTAGLAGDTEDFEEALKGLSPAAQNVARDVAGLRGRLDELKGAVQESLFAPLVDSVRPLADAYLPALQSNLSAIAGTFGQVGNQTAGFLAMPATSEAVNKALANMREAVVNVVSGVGSLVQAFLPLVTVGSTFLPQLTDGFGGATARVASFMREAERTGELAGFIQRGLDSLKSLWATGGQVVRIFKDIGAIGSMVWERVGLQSGGLLDTIERLVDRVRAFFESSEGGDALGQVLGVLGQIASSAAGTLQRLVEMIAPFLPQIGEFALAFTELKAAILDALGPVIDFIGGTVLPMLTTLMTFLADNVPLVQALIIALFANWVAGAAAATAASLGITGPIGLIAFAIAALAALVVIHWDTIKAAGVAVWHAIHGAVSWVVGAVSGAVSWVADFVQGAWNRIRYAGVAVWHAIEGAATWARDVVTGAFDWVRDRVVGVWDAIWDKVAWVRDSIGDAVEWVKDKLAGIAEAISDLPGAGVVRGIAGAFGIGNAHGGIVGAASGGLRSGLHLVGERGAELVNLPAGSRVIPNNEMGRALGGAGGGGGVTIENHFHIAGSILAERDLVKIVGDAIRLGDMRDPLAVAGVRPV